LVRETTRAAIGKQSRDRYIQQQCCGGLNFGYFYVSTLLGTKPGDWKKESN
jgi:acyl CoA:acetate/3-ketoacid CoA transferase alpha subunit